MLGSWSLYPKLRGISSLFEQAIQIRLLIVLNQVTNREKHICIFVPVTFDLR